METLLVTLNIMIVYDVNGDTDDVAVVHFVLSECSSVLVPAAAV
jgi:hypothetical protein